MIKIKDCQELLVELAKECPKLLTFKNPRSNRKRSFYVRKTIAKKLCQAQKYLPKGMKFLITFTTRSSEEQKKIFERFVKRFSNQHPSWTKSKVLREVKKYVHPFKGKYASGHLTGGAVDLTLWKGGRRVAMNSLKLPYQENAKTTQPKLPAYIQRNRKIMFDALKKVGFSNYPKEYWHWSYGDIHWAKREKRKVVIYGIVKDLIL